MAPGGSLHAVRGFASKDVEHICRIAASMHAVCGRGLTIDVHTVHQAAQIVTWFGNQTMMVFDPLGPLSPLAGKALTLLEYIRRSFWTINRPAIRHGARLDRCQTRPDRCSCATAAPARVNADRTRLKSRARHY
jgi:hypothetical protein